MLHAQNLSIFSISSLYLVASLKHAPPEFMGPLYLTKGIFEKTNLWQYSLDCLPKMLLSMKIPDSASAVIHGKAQAAVRTQHSLAE